MNTGTNLLKFILVRLHCIVYVSNFQYFNDAQFKYKRATQKRCFKVVLLDRIEH